VSRTNVLTVTSEALLIENLGIPSVISTIRFPFSSNRVTFLISTGLVVEGLPIFEMTKDIVSFASTPVFLRKVNSAITVPVGTYIISVLDANGLFTHI